MIRNNFYMSWKLFQKHILMYALNIHAADHPAYKNVLCVSNFSHFQLLRIKTHITVTQDDIVSPLYPPTKRFDRTEAQPLNHACVCAASLLQYRSS